VLILETVVTMQVAHLDQSRKLLPSQEETSVGVASC
jgi:hypothetical protein